MSFDFTVCFTVELDEVTSIIYKLQSGIDKIESQLKILADKCDASAAVRCSAGAPKTASEGPTTKDEVLDGDDGNVDLFGSDSEVCLACKWVEFLLLTLTEAKTATYCITPTIQTF
jgi:hypothetical protein